MKRLFVFLSILFLVGCSTNTSLIEIKKHIYVEKEFEDSWLELNEKGDSYIKEELQGGYQYSYDQKYLKQFFKDDGIETELHYIHVSDENWKKQIEERNKRVESGNGGADFYLDEGLMKKLVSKFEEPTEDEVDVWYENDYMSKKI